MTLSPVIILTRPQMGENIGAAARAMANFGLSELRLVAPRDGWPNEKATAMAAGGESVLAKASVHNTLAEALHDCHYVYATSARLRDMELSHHSPRAAMDFLAMRGGSPKLLFRVAFVFGAENNGLSNVEVSHAHALLHIPTAPAYGVLNIAQAVGIICYEWYHTLYVEKRGIAPATMPPSPIPITHNMVMSLYEVFCEYLKRAGNPPTMLERNKLMQLLLRLSLQERDVQMLHSIIRSIGGWVKI